MSIRASIRLAALATVACAATLLAGCGSSGSVSPTTAGGGSSTTGGSVSQPGSGTSSGSDAKCTDLTGAAASAAVGKSTTVTLDATVAPLSGLTICNVVVADEVYPIQLAVDTVNAQATYAGDEQAFSGVDMGGVGDKAFSSSVGVEVLSGRVDITVTGPAGPVLNGNYTVPTAVAKAMVAALK
jgi:hypothetical protein